MYYSYNKDVFLVKGLANDAIYDLLSGKLYHLKKSEGAVLEKIIGKKDTDEFSEKELSAINQLQELHLIIKTEKIENADIKSRGKDTYIKFAWIEVCTTCNLKCKHCYNESSPKTKSFLSLEEFKNICSQLKEIGVTKIQLIGGEPFCHNDILKMLEMGSKNFEFVEVFTNGTLLDFDRCKFLKENNIKVALSVYSYMPEEHDKVTTVQGSHKKTCNTIKNLKDLGVTYRIATTHMNGISIGEKNTELFSIHLKKDVVRIAGRANLHLLTETLLKRKLITKETFSHKLDKTRILENTRINHCFGTKIYISSNLDVFPCAMERRFSHGNLKKERLKNLIKSEIRYMNKDMIDDCKFCELRYACYDCRPDSLSDSKFAKPYFCTYDVYSGTWENLDTFAKKCIFGDLYDE